MEVSHSDVDGCVEKIRYGDSFFWMNQLSNQRCRAKLNETNSNTNDNFECTEHVEIESPNLAES